MLRVIFELQHRSTTEKLFSCNLERRRYSFLESLVHIQDYIERGFKMSVTVLLNNWSAANPPTATDDNTDGYEPGSLWRTSTEFYICANAATGAAIWTQIPLLDSNGHLVGPIINRNGTQAAIPVLNVGEIYQTTDKSQGIYGKAASTNLFIAAPMQIFRSTTNPCTTWSDAGVWHQIQSRIGGTPIPVIITPGSAGEIWRISGYVQLDIVDGDDCASWVIGFSDQSHTEGFFPGHKGWGWASGPGVGGIGIGPNAVRPFAGAGAWVVTPDYASYVSTQQDPMITFDVTFRATGSTGIYLYGWTQTAIIDTVNVTEYVVVAQRIG
ncbi:MAG: hypothetical protein H7144_07075 [Burkholderiales bacterium]|nr:hypothetical protein [Phycisphaerae bacterium]